MSILSRIFGIFQLIHLKSSQCKALCVNTQILIHYQSITFYVCKWLLKNFEVVLLYEQNFLINRFPEDLGELLHFNIVIE